MKGEKGMRRGSEEKREEERGGKASEIIVYWSQGTVYPALARQPINSVSLPRLKRLQLRFASLIPATTIIV